MAPLGGYEQVVSQEAAGIESWPPFLHELYRGGLSSGYGRRPGSYTLQGGLPFRPMAKSYVPLPAASYSVALESFES